MELGEDYMGKLVCPICGAFTSAEPAEFGARVKIERSSGLRFELGTAIAAAYDENRKVTHGILDCQACGRRFVGIKDTGSSEWSAVYPIAAKDVGPEIPEPIRGELKEAYLCFAVGAYRGCVSMCETALEALWRKQKASGLLDLKEKGIISPQLYEQGDEVRLWGNVAKHELVPDVVEKEDAEQLLTYLDAILNAVYVEPERLSRLTQKREQLKESS